MIVGLLHPGMMGAAVGAQLVAGGHEVRWCPAGRSDRTAARADAAGLIPLGSLADLLAGSEVVFAICPPANADDVADQVAGFTGVYVEANAINPARMTAIATRLTDAGATVVDGAIIGPPPAGDRGPRCYLSGPAAAVGTVTGLLAGSLAEPKPIDDRIGAASALKMAYGSFNKTSWALAAVSHALADRYGVTDQLLAEGNRYSARALADRDDLASTATRAWRWGPELAEVAQTLRDAGLPDALATGAVRVFGRWDDDKDDDDLDTTTALEHLRREP